MNNKLLLYVITATFFLSTITPLLVPSSLIFPFITSKVLFFRLIITICSIFLIVLLIKKEEILIKKSYILLFLTLLVLWTGISNVFGVNITESFFSDLSRMDGWLSYIYGLCFIVIASVFLNSTKKWNWFLGSSIFIAHIVALNALQSDEARISGFIGNAAFLAIYMLFNVYFVLFLFYQSYKNNVYKTKLTYAQALYFLYSIVLFSYIIIQTQTRGAILGLLISIFLFLILTTISFWKFKIVKLISISLCFIIMLGSLLIIQNRDSVFVQNNETLKRITNISPSEGTGFTRIGLWNIAVQGIKERPFLGWGQENYPYVFAKYYEPKLYQTESWQDRAHNTFLDIGVSNGVIGLILYILVLFSIIYTIFKSNRFDSFEKNTLYSLLCAYCIHNFFVFDSYISYFLFYTLIAFIIFNSDSKTIILKISNVGLKLLAYILISILIISSYFTIYTPYKYAQIISKTITDDLKSNLENYEILFEKELDTTEEALINYLALAEPVKKLNDQNLFEMYQKRAHEQIEKKISKTNSGLKLMQYYGIFLSNTNQSIQAIEIFEKVRTISPNRQENLYLLAFEYVKQKEFEKALEIFKYAYELDTSNQEAKRYYGGALLLTGSAKGEEYVQGYSYKDTFFLDVFLLLEKYEEVLKIVQNLTKDNPESFVNQVSLAVAYVLNEQRNTAIEILYSLENLNQQQQQHIQNLIFEIKSGKKVIVQF